MKTSSLDTSEFLPGRRALLIAAGAALTTAGCSKIRSQTSRITGAAKTSYVPLVWNGEKSETARVVLNRAAFGPDSGAMNAVSTMGAANWLEEQLQDKLDEDPIVSWRVDSLETLQDEKDAPDVLYDMSDEQLLREIQQAAILRAVYSRHQLRETLADFWTNHFNIYALKNDGRALIPSDSERVIRPHVLGSFHDMLHSSAQSSAMLAYLDNNLNRRGVANENYARELLELHTLGVHSGYTLKDIQAVARCFTGWTVQTGFKRGMPDYDLAQHDDGLKYIPFLNLTIQPNGGKRDAAQVLDALAYHPATARFIASKLCMRYLGAAPEPIVTKAASAYLINKTDLKSTLRPILLDGLLNPDYRKPILKRPLDFAASALRALSADTDGGNGIQEYLAAMGQPLYQWPMPDGFPSKTSAWTGSLLGRWNFALALTSDHINGTTVDIEGIHGHYGANDLDRMLETILSLPANHPSMSELKTALKKYQVSNGHNFQEISVLAGLCVASPVFQSC